MRYFFISRIIFQSIFQTVVIIIIELEIVESFFWLRDFFWKILIYLRSIFFNNGLVCVDFGCPVHFFPKSGITNNHRNGSSDISY